MHAHVCVLADSTAAEKRFTAKSTGCLLQGAAGTTAEEGTDFPQTDLRDFLHFLSCFVSDIG